MTQINNESNRTNPDEITIKELFLKIGRWRKYIVSKWKMILIVAIIGGVIGVFYALFRKPIYKAELSFALEDDKTSGGGLSNALGLASQFGIDLGEGGGGAFSGDNLLELIKSRSMVESALLTQVNIKGRLQTLASYYINFNDLRKKWNDKPELKDIQFINQDRSKFTLQQDSILGVFYKEIIKKNLTVDKVDKKLSIITVKVESTNELFSKYFTEVLVKTVSNFYIITKTEKSVQNVAILQRQTDSVRRELNSALTGVATSTDINPNPNPTLQILRVPSQRRQVDVQANQAILTQLVANLEMSKVSLRKETPLIQIIDQPILPLEKEKISILKGCFFGVMIGIILSMLFFSLKRLANAVML